MATILGDDYYKNLLDKLYDGICCIGPDRRINYWNRAAERITGWSGPEVVDGGLCFEVLAHTDGRGEPHCRVDCLAEQTLVDGQPREGDYFIRHRDGHRVPVSTRIEALRDLGGATTGAVLIFHDNSSRIAARSVIESLRKLAMIDPLTGLANRRYLERAITGKVDEYRRYGLSFGLLFIDIDHFKQVNDCYGHEVGDRVLWTTAQVMSTAIRCSDILGRWGGEEFLALILNVHREELLLVAEKLRAGVERTLIECEGGPLQVTVSIGGVQADAERELDREALVRRADELMYRSKHTGRNRVSLD